MNVMQIDKLVVWLMERFYCLKKQDHLKYHLGSYYHKKIDNLISTFCVSATHVAFGTIRVEPTLIQLGEVAGFASFEALIQKINMLRFRSQ